MTYILDVTTDIHMQELLFTSTLSSIITLAVLFAIFIGVVQDNFFIPSLLLLLGIGVLFFLKRDDMWNTVTDPKVAYGALAYIPIGLVFSLFQYRRYILKVKKEGRDTKNHGPENHKADITGWVIYWPFALLGNMFGFFLIDLIGNIKDWIYNSFKGLFQRIYDTNK